MHEVMLPTFLAILETFIAFALGAWLVRKKVLDDSGIQQLSNLTLDVLFPLMTLGSVTRNFSAPELLKLWILPAIAVAVMFAGWCFSFILERFMFCKTTSRQAMFRHFCTCNNYLFLPLIVLNNLWGERCVSLLLVMNIGFTVGFWVIGIAAFGGSDLKEMLRNIFSINLYAVALALFMVGMGWRLPSVIEHVAVSFGDAAVPLVLIGIGAAIWKNIRSFGKHFGDCIYLTLVRLILLPVLTILLLRLLPIPEDYFKVAAVVALMPVSSSSILVARRYGGDLEFASQSIVMTTLCSIITAPLMLGFLL